MKKTIAIILIALFVLLVTSAVAENKTVIGVVVNYRITNYGTKLVSVVDEEGDILSYYVDETDSVAFGDVVCLEVTPHANKEDVEVLDATSVGHFDLVRTIRWIRR